MVVIKYSGYAEAGLCTECRKKEKEVFALAFGEDGADGSFCRACLLRVMRSHAKSAVKTAQNGPLFNHVEASHA